MLGFYYSTDKIIRIMFIVSVFVIHRWLCSPTNHNSARCRLHTVPAKCTQRHTIDKKLKTRQTAVRSDSGEERMAALCGW